MTIINEPLAKVTGYSVEPFEYEDGFAVMNIRVFVPFSSPQGFDPIALYFPKRYDFIYSPLLFKHEEQQAKTKLLTSIYQPGGII